MRVLAAVECFDANSKSIWTAISLYFLKSILLLMQRSFFIKHCSNHFKILKRKKNCNALNAKNRMLYSLVSSGVQFLTYLFLTVDSHQCKSSHRQPRGTQWHKCRRRLRGAAQSRLMTHRCRGGHSKGHLWWRKCQPSCWMMFERSLNK